MISKTASHAVLALSVLAGLPPRTYLGAADIAARIGAPKNYLAKLLKMFAAYDLVESQKGKGGGFRLAKPPAEIPLIDVVEPIDHVSRWRRCFLGPGPCSDGDPCPLHDQWKRVREEYLHFLQTTTIDDLGQSARS